MAMYPEINSQHLPASAQPASRRWIVPLAVLALLLLGGWLFISFYLYFRTSGPVAQGMMVGSTAVGGLTLEQAAARIDNDWNREKILVVSDGKNYWEAQPLEFGLWVDPGATARKAYEYGRGEGRWGELIGILLGATPPEIQPQVVFSPQVAAEQLSFWGALVDRPPEAARLVYADGRWQAIPGQPGVQYDPESTLRQMGENYTLILLSGFLQLSTRSVPSPVEALEAKIPELEARLDRPLRVHGYDPVTDQTLEWDVPRETLAGWVRVDPLENGLRLRIDENGFPSYLDSLQARLGDGRTVWIPGEAYTLTERWETGRPYTVILRQPATRYTVEPGDTLLRISYRQQVPAWMILRANPGLNPDSIPVGSVLEIPSKSDLLPYPVVLGKRIVISITDQRMYVYENGSQVRDFIISTGIDRSPTQPGVFQVQTHDLEAYASVWDLYMPHFIGIYEAWPGFMNGIHGLPTLSNGQRLWAGNLGRPVSFGCIILNLDTAEWLFNWAERGVVVEIRA